jgi:hypothetical protein
MNSLLDPPLECEPPECCGDYMDVLECGTCVCPICKREIKPVPDIEPVD